MNDETRTPPHDPAAEQSVLGAMMLSRDALTEAAGLLRAESFYRPNHGRIFEVILSLDTRGEPADAVTVAAALTDAGDINRVGGAPYLHTLIETVPSASNVGYYAKTVADKALDRELQKTAIRMMQLATSGGDPAAKLQAAQQWLADIEGSLATAEGGPRMWGDLVQEVMDEIEQAEQSGSEVPGIPTGLHDLDRLLTGLHPGQLIVVGARPGVGKSVLLAGCAQHAAWKQKLPAVIFSLEMGATELGKRLISADAKVPLHLLKTGKLSDTDWTKIARTAGESAGAPLAIDDTCALTVADIRTRARKLHRQCGGLALIAVDYLQLITPPKGQSREQEVAAISRGLKLLAKQLQVPVVVAAQLNRNPESRADKRPTIADLRESGAIEADADVVILIHREDAHDKESPRAGEADLIVDKNRNGATDTITVASQLHLARFQSMAIV